MSALSDVANIAVQEVSEAARSRRAAVLLLLYLAAALLSMHALVAGLQRMEREVRTLMGLPQDSRGGAVTEVLWRSEQLRSFVRAAVRDEAAARDLFAAHPLALVFGGLAFFYTPLLVMLVTPARVAEELATGTARYALARTTRARWAIGKAVAHAALTGLALLMGAAGAWIVARLRLSAADGGLVALGLLGASARTWVFAIAYIGWACGIACWTRSAGRATALGLVFLLGLAAAGWGGVALARRGHQPAAHAVRTVLPQRYRLDLWRRSVPHAGGAVLALTAFGALGLGSGIARISGRDV